MYLNICRWRHAIQTPPKLLHITVSVCYHHSKICKQMNYRTVKMVPIKIISTILVFLLIETSLCQNEMQIMAENTYMPGILQLHSLNTLRTGLLNCLNARSRGLTFRHRASCIQGQAFRYSPEKAFYIFNQDIYFII